MVALAGTFRVRCGNDGPAERETQQVRCSTDEVGVAAGTKGCENPGMDSQTVEIIGRNYLVSMLVSDGLEVARPERDRGVDLIAYLDLDEVGRFVACPIQMKAATTASFSLHDKYERIAQLLLVHVWYVQDPDQACAYALRYDEAKRVADQMGWTSTDSWRRGGYSTTRPSGRLKTLLAPYRMSAGCWRRKVQEAGTARSL